MIVDVEMAIYHYQFMVCYYTDLRDVLDKTGLPKEKREYRDLMKKSIVSEIKIMVLDNEYNIYHSVLSMYMKSKVLKDFVRELFNSKEMLTPKVVYLAWSQGNINVIQNCIGLGIDTEPQKNISCAIRSDCCSIVDTCVEMGASLRLPLMPYRHCKSVSMVNHLSKIHQCKLHNMARKLPGNHIVSSEYLFLGGHIEEMGYLNETLRTRGNIERSLPIKKAYIRSKREGIRESLEGIGRCLLLPGFVVRSITEYI